KACAVVDAAGRSIAAGDLAKHTDPIAQRVLLGGCPQGGDGIISSLKTAKSCKKSQITSRLASDRSLLLDKADDVQGFRAVLSQDCDGDPNNGEGNELFVSVFGVNAKPDGKTPAKTLPQGGTEVIGHDTTNGVFNF